MADQELDATQEGAEELSEDLAKKYDPERLLKIVSKRAGRGESLDLYLRNKYEKRFGVDLSHVKIYSGEFAEEFNKKHNAYAVTISNTGMILMGGSAEKSMGSASGQALLAHELTHVAQQRRGLSFSSVGGMPFGEEHEAEAEQVEQEVLKAAKAQGPTVQQIREAIERSEEEVKERVLEMLTESMISHEHRNGSQRRA